ncbi:TonB-dependent receptor [Desulfonema ishimotonii]|uniref:TonB-dependent receptor n=1 Tax=Desulfonema ishimotonii TaxID=45657 RepID=A0A401G036_9BACT|nr:TonB-dependent receptor [Desulfonema ishimotonii]GBC62578.1 TonB-dependent receptor [Desulfonema ishimotonii]
MKFRTCILIVATLVLTGQSGISFSEDAYPEEDSYTLDTVTVEAQREISAERNAERISIQDEAAPVISTVPDILKHTTGLDVQGRSVLTPKSSQVRIRGFDERRSLIMLDGRPLNGTGVMGGQFVDWSALSLQGWEAVDVGKGAFSAKYGNTLGGTINLIPTEPGDDPAFSAHTGFKRYDTFSAGVSGSGKYGPLGAQLSAGYTETDGNLRNSEAERADFGSRFYWSWGGDGQIQAGFRYTDGDFNMPVENRKNQAGYDDAYPESGGSYLIGPGIKFPSGDRHGDGSFYTKERYELDLSVRKKIAGTDSELKLYFNNEDREDTVYSYDLDEIVLKREATPDRSWGWVTRFSRMFGEHLAGFGADGNYQGYGGSTYTFIRDDYFSKAPTDGNDEADGTRWHGVYLDDQWALTRQLDLYMGLRYEQYYGDRKIDAVAGYRNRRPTGYETVEAEFDENTLLPKLGLVWRPVGGLALHGRFARATRFPDNPAFYWYYGGYRPEVDPDSDLVRKDLTFEDALQYEVGLSYTGIPNLSLSLNYYYYDVDDYIRWIFGYSPSRVVYNIDNVEFQGIELDAEGKVWEDVYVFANFTWQDTKKEGDVLDGSNALSDELSELPEYKFNMGVKYQREDGAMAKLTLRWVDDRQVPYLRGSAYTDGTAVGSDVTMKNMDDFITVDVLCKYPVWKTDAVRGFLTAGVENLFDEDYEEEFDFPAPGQTFSIGAEIRF